MNIKRRNILIFIIAAFALLIALVIFFSDDILSNLQYEPETDPSLDDIDHAAVARDEQAPIDADVPAANFENCQALFLDLGANIGVSGRKFFEPHRYANTATLVDLFWRRRFGPAGTLLERRREQEIVAASQKAGARWKNIPEAQQRSECCGAVAPGFVRYGLRMKPALKRGGKESAVHTAAKSACALVVEPSPRHQKRLTRLEKRYRASGLASGFAYVQAGISDKEGEKEFEYCDKCHSNDFGATFTFRRGMHAKPAHNAQEKTTTKMVKIHTIPSLLDSIVVPTLRNGNVQRTKVRVGIKLDIEGEELGALKQLVRDHSDLLCASSATSRFFIEFIAMEWHHHDVSVPEFISELLSGVKCSSAAVTDIFELDDESFLFDPVALPPMQKS